MSNAVKMAFAGLEEKISSILHRTLDVVLAWATKVLATQKKTDFRPKDDTAMDELFALQTPTCHSLSTFLTKVYSRASAALEEPSIGYFSTEVAAGVRALLLEHFRKFNVNAAGGLLVSKDVSKYVETMRGWPLGSPVEAGLSNLTEVANLFVIGPEAIRERLRAAANASGLEPTMQELRAYVLKREDSGTVAIQAVLNSL